LIVKKAAAGNTNPVTAAPKAMQIFAFCFIPIPTTRFRFANLMLGKRPSNPFLLFNQNPPEIKNVNPHLFASQWQKMSTFAGRD
jgi:hypothetical protein